MDMDTGERGGGLHLHLQTLHHGSLPLHCIPLRLNSSNDTGLCLIRGNALEVISVNEDGVVRTVCCQNIFENIHDCVKISSFTDGVERLIVIGDSGHLTSFLFDPQLTQDGRFFSDATARTAESARQPNSASHHLAVDPRGRCAITAGYLQSFLLFPISFDDHVVFEQPFEYRFPWSAISSIVCLYTQDNQVYIAVHHQKVLEQQASVVTVLEVDLTRKLVMEREHFPTPTDEIVSVVLACPHLMNGLTIISNHSVRLLDVSRRNSVPILRASLSEYIQPGSFVSSAQWLGTTLYICVNNGDFIGMTMSGTLVGVVAAVKVLGRVGECRAFGILPNNTFYLPNARGDGLVARVSSDMQLQLLSEITSLAPIHDARLVDLNDDGQQVLVTASGLPPYGTIRTVRHAVGVSIVGESAFDAVVNGSWSLTVGRKNYLLISFIENTRLMSVGNELDDASDTSGLDCSSATLACGVFGTAIVQVTASSVVIGALGQTATQINLSSQSASSHLLWQPGGRQHIAAASVDGDLVILALSDNSICLLRLSDFTGVIRCVVIGATQCSHYVSAVRITCIAQNERMIPVAVIGTYEPSLTVLSLDPDSLFAVISAAPLSSLSSDGIAIPHSICACALESMAVAADYQQQQPPRFLFVGLRDGTVVQYWFDGGQLSDAFSRRIGVKPVELVLCGEFMIALSNRPWIVKMMNNNVTYTAVAHSAVNHAAPLNSSQYKDGAAFFNDVGLSLVTLQSQRNMLYMEKFEVDVPKEGIMADSRFAVPVVPKRVLFHQTSRRFVVAGHHVSPDGKSFSDLRLVNIEGSSPPLVLTLGREETVYCLETFGDCIIVGCGVAVKNGASSSGWVRLYEVTSDPATPELKVLTRRAELQLPGICYAARQLDDSQFLASANDEVYAVNFHAASSSLSILRRTRTRGFVNSLSASHARVAIGDKRDSLSFYSNPQLGAFELRQGDRRPGNVQDCVLLDDCTAVCVDIYGSLIAFRYDENGDIRVEKALEPTTFVSLFEIGRKVCKGSFAYDMPGTTPPNAVIIPTLSGSILTAFEISRSEHTLLQELQTRMRNYPPTAPLLGGDLVRERGRLYPMTRVIDGDLVSLYSQLLPAEQLEVLVGWVGMTPDQILITLNSILQKMQ